MKNIFTPMNKDPLKNYEYCEVDGMTMLARKRVNQRDLAVACGLGLMLFILLAYLYLQASASSSNAYGEYMNQCYGHIMHYVECERNAPIPTP